MSSYGFIATSLLLMLCSARIFTYLRRLTFDPLSKIPGPWICAASSIWIRWQRWNGRMSFKADQLLTQYGPIVRISPSMVLVNDLQTVEEVFKRKDLDTAPTSIRALRVGGHDWTVTYPGHPIARQRRHPVMIATTTKNLRALHEAFESNILGLTSALVGTGRNGIEDIVYHLRICTLRNSQLVIGGPSVDVVSPEVPNVIGQYNFLVIWRLCLPEWTFSWLESGPFRAARARLRSSNRLYDIGASICKQARTGDNRLDGSRESSASNIYELFTDSDAKYPTQQMPEDELDAEMAGQVLAATETTSSALAFIFYELAKNPTLLQCLYEEVKNCESSHDLDSLEYLDACIKEGLRFRPPVALTGSRLVPAGGLEVMGYRLPAGTVITTQSLSMSRQRSDLFPDCDEYRPERWLETDDRAERRRLLVPFGVGARRCPGGNMALYQMRLILAAVVGMYHITVPPETTSELMEPFEANGYRSRNDECRLTFVPRGATEQAV